MSFPLDSSPDPRDPELARAHSVLAGEAHKSLKQRMRELGGKYPESVPEPGSETPLIDTDVNQPPAYGVKLNVSGIIGVSLDISFSDSSCSFNGAGIGGAWGINVTWGTANFNYSLATMTNWEALFQLNFSWVVTEVTLWGMHGEYIGIIVAGGIGLGAGSIGGQGKFASSS